MFTYIIFVSYNIIYIYHFTNVFTRVIEHFPNVLHMVIVNNFHNPFFSLFLSYFENILCLPGFLIIFVVSFPYPLHVNLALMLWAILEELGSRDQKRVGNLKQVVFF